MCALPSRPDALGAVVDTGLGFDFQVKVDPASPPALAQEREFPFLSTFRPADLNRTDSPDPYTAALHDVPVYTLAVPPPMLERAGSATSSDRPLSGYSSSGCDGDVSASDRGDQSADEEDEGDDEACQFSTCTTGSVPPDCTWATLTLTLVSSYRRGGPRFVVADSYGARGNPAFHSTAQADRRRRDGRDDHQLRLGGWHPSGGVG